MPENGDKHLEILRQDVVHLNERRCDYPVDCDFMPACRRMNGAFDNYWIPHFVARDISPFYYEPSDSCVLLFSGGKVSTATALRLRSMHKDVTLLHVKTLTPPKDVSRIRKIADDLKLPLLVCEDIDMEDNAFYGMRLAQTALEYAVRNGMSPKIYMGCFDMASILNNKPEDWKYCIEFISTYARVARKYIFGADILRIMPSYQVLDDEFVRNKALLKYFK